MKCEICQRTADQDGVILHRVNEKGVIGAWRCTDHLPEGFQVDPVVKEILDIIEEDNRSQ